MAKAAKNTEETPVTGEAPVQEPIQPEESPEGTGTDISELKPATEGADNANADDHLSIDQAREEITEYNQEVEKGNIPSDSIDSIDVALEKVKEAKEKTGNQSVLDVLNESNAPTDTAVEDDSDEGLGEEDKLADHSEWDDYEDEAEDLMAKQYLKEIWRCPVTGYWFSSKIYAEDHQKKTGKDLEHYKA